MRLLGGPPCACLSSSSGSSSSTGSPARPQQRQDSCLSVRATSAWRCAKEGIAACSSWDDVCYGSPSTLGTTGALRRRGALTCRWQARRSARSCARSMSSSWSRARKGDLAEKPFWQSQLAGLLFQLSNGVIYLCSFLRVFAVAVNIDAGAQKSAPHVVQARVHERARSRPLAKHGCVVAPSLNFMDGAPSRGACSLARLEELGALALTRLTLATLDIDTCERVLYASRDTLEYLALCSIGISHASTALTLTLPSKLRVIKVEHASPAFSVGVTPSMLADGGNSSEGQRGGALHLLGSTRMGLLYRRVSSELVGSSFWFTQPIRGGSGETRGSTDRAPTSWGVYRLSKKARWLVSSPTCRTTFGYSIFSPSFTGFVGRIESLTTFELRLDPSTYLSSRPRHGPSSSTP